MTHDTSSHGLRVKADALKPVSIKPRGYYALDPVPRDACGAECNCTRFACLRCEHKACGWCPDCHPEVPDL